MYFSIFNPDFEGFYVEIDHVDSITEVIQSLLVRYNDSNERQPICLILIKEISKLLIIIVRAIAIPHGCLLLIALKGSGIQSLQKLASFSLGYMLKDLQASNDKTFTRVDWLALLKNCMISADRDDKNVLLTINQYNAPPSRIAMETFIEDVQCIVKN